MALEDRREIGIYPQRLKREALLLAGLLLSSIMLAILLLAGLPTAAVAGVVLAGVLLTTYGIFCAPLPVMVVIFIFATFEGFIKHKLGYALMTYILKDGIILALFVAWLIKAVMHRHGLYRRTMLDIPLALFSLLCFVQIFNPYFDNWIISLSGIKVHLVCIPLYFFAFYLIDDKARLKRMLHIFALLAIAMAAYGIVQYIQGPDVVSSLGPSFAEIVRRDTWWAGSKHYFRPMSFAPTGGLAGAFYMLGFPFVALMIYISRAWLLRLLWIIGLLLLTVAIVLTGVRSALLTVIIAGVIISLLFSRKLLLPLILVIAIGLFASFSIGGGLIQHRVGTLQNPYDNFMRNRFSYISMIPEIIANYPVGMGMARTGAAAGALSKFYPNYERMTLDNYYSVMVFETSVVGLLLTLLIFGIVIGKGADIVRKQRGEGRAIATALLTVPLCILVFGFSGPTLTVSPFNIYFWTVSGMLMKLPLLYAVEDAL